MTNRDFEIAESEFDLPQLPSRAGSVMSEALAGDSRPDSRPDSRYSFVRSGCNVSFIISQDLLTGLRSFTKLYTYQST